MSGVSPSSSLSARARSASSSSDETDPSSCSEHTLRIDSNISVIFEPTNGSDHVNASMKFGSQYGCELALYCLQGDAVRSQLGCNNLRTPT